MKTLLLFILSITFLKAGVTAQPHAVIIAGTHHYSPQKTMPPFAAELERLGFKTTVINPDWDPEKDKRGLPGLEALKTADLGIFFVRFLKLDDEQLSHITDFVEAGKPLVCFRTSTHAFNYPKDHPKHSLNMSFGRDAFGTPYQIHLTGGTEITPSANALKHPILTGIDSGGWKSPGTLYLTKLEPGTEALLTGTGKSKPGMKTNPFGTHDLKAEMTDTVAWTWKNKWGGRVFSTSLGHPDDFAVPQSMRVMVNGTFWAAGLPVPDTKTKVKSFTLKAPEKKKRAAKKKPEKALSTMPDTKMKSGGVTVFYGNGMVERLQEDGTFEALMQAARPGEKRQYRSLAYTGDEVGFRIRPGQFGNHLAYITSQTPADKVVMCFGMNEAFAGSLGLPAFEKALDSYLKIIKERHHKSDLFLVTPTPVEGSDDRNEIIRLYAMAMQDTATLNGVTTINFFFSCKELFSESEEPLTSNGLHLNEAGVAAVAKLLASYLDRESANVDTSAPGFESLRKMVSRKAYEVAMAYHPANGIHYYGTRSRPFEYATEIPHHLRLANLLDKAIWKQAADLKNAHPFPKLPVTQAEPPAKNPRKGLGLIKTSKDDLADFKVADGFEVKLFASSEEFPELINPLQIQFDTRGRLWVSCFASYPVPLPGTLSNDTILIFEDTDGDGKADKRTVFADGLKLPDGFVFYKDGVIASIARKLIWLRDTDGDDISDTQVELLRGADDTDTHHGGFLARTPQGDVIYCEGLFHRGQFETPHGPVRTKDATALRFDPVTSELTIERQTNHPNPWKISYNRWGESLQMFGGGQIIDCDSEPLEASIPSTVR